MRKLSFSDALEQIIKEDKRYDAEAYLFVKEALDWTIKMLDKPLEGIERHVTGTDLLEGIRRYALSEYGPLALRVLNTWGITRTEDFGEIVFNLVEKGVLGKTSNDKKSDFAGGYNFHEAFRKPFLPSGSAHALRSKVENARNKSHKTTLGDK